jgi:hypothetical protein
MTAGAEPPLPTPTVENATAELRHAPLPALVARLERIRATAADVVADTRDLRLIPPTDGSGWGYLRVPHYGELPLRRHAAIQLAEVSGVPMRYADRMATEMPDLLAENVNRWLDHAPARRLVRMAEDHVRAVVSDRYRVADNYDLAWLLADRAERHGAQVLDCSLTETTMSIRITVPGAAQLVRAGDTVVPGLRASNSEVGAGAWTVEPYTYRLLCRNGLIGEAALYRVHLGRAQAVGAIDYRADTLAAESRALLLQARDVVDATFDPETLSRIVEQLRAATAVPIHEPVRVLSRHVDALDLSDDRRAALLQAYGRAGDDTLYGLTQAITATAREAPTEDEQARLERYAGALLARPQEAVA